MTAAQPIYLDETVPLARIDTEPGRPGPDGQIAPDGFAYGPKQPVTHYRKVYVGEWFELQPGDPIPDPPAEFRR